MISDAKADLIASLFTSAELLNVLTADVMSDDKEDLIASLLASAEPLNLVTLDSILV